MCSWGSAWVATIAVVAWTGCGDSGSSDDGASSGSTAAATEGPGSTGAVAMTTSGPGTAATTATDGDSTGADGTTGVTCVPSGAIDPSFGVDGVVTLPGVPSGGGSDSEADAPVEVAYQADGSILVAAVLDGQTSVLRLDGSGALDPTFGVDGVVALPTSFSSSAHGLVVDAAGMSVALTGSGIVRLSPDGALDLGYGTDGIGSTPFQTYGLGVADDGAVIAVGMIGSDEGTGYEGAVARLQPDGMLDLAFGVDGHFEVYDVSANALTRFLAVAVFADQLIVGGEGATGSGFFAGLTADGQLDAAFGSGGTLSIQVGESSDAVQSLAIEPSGDGVGWLGYYRDFVMTGGGTGVSLGQLSLAGMSGGAVKIETPTGPNAGTALAILDGGDRVYGATYTYNDSDRDFVVVRTDSGGALVTDFGTDGVARLQLPTRDQASDFALAPDGLTAVATGVATTDFNGPTQSSQAIVARFLIDDCQ